MNQPSVTVADLDELIAKIAKKEGEIEIQEDILKEKNKELATLQGKCVQYLNELNRKNYESPSGKVTIAQKWRVNLPADDNAKRALFEHLRERGIFDKYATVNSNSLNSLYKQDWEAAKERGEGLEFSMPGIGAPNLFEALSFKAAK